MIVGAREESWTLPNGDVAMITVELHHDGTKIVPVTYDLFARMAQDLGFVAAATS